MKKRYALESFLLLMIGLTACTQSDPNTAGKTKNETEVLTETQLEPMAATDESAEEMVQDRTETEMEIQSELQEEDALKSVFHLEDFKLVGFGIERDHFEEMSEKVGIEFSVPSAIPGDDNQIEKTGFVSNDFCGISAEVRKIGENLNPNAHAAHKSFHIQNGYTSDMIGHIVSADYTVFDNGSIVFSMSMDNEADSDEMRLISEYVTSPIVVGDTYEKWTQIISLDEIKAKLEAVDCSDEYEKEVYWGNSEITDISYSEASFEMENGEAVIRGIYTANPDGKFIRVQVFAREEDGVIVSVFVYT